MQAITTFLNIPFQNCCVRVIQAFQQISGSYDSRKVISGGYKRLSDAFRLLQSDPAVKVHS